MPDPTPSFAGVLVTYRRPESLPETIRRLLAQTRQLDQLLVIDNGSDRAVADLVAEVGRDNRVTYFDAGGNLGPAGGYALGIRWLLAKAEDQDWVFLLDDDDPPFFDDAFEKAARFAEAMVAQDPNVAAVGISGGRFDFDRGLVRRIGDDEIFGAVSVDHITGGGLPAYRVASVRAVGPPLEDLFFGFEELEFGLRLKAAGYSLYADGDQWRRRKEVKREQGLLPPEDVSARRAEETNWKVTTPSWRRYYSLRNLTFILRSHGRSWTAMKVGLSRGIGKPLLNIPLSPGPAWSSLRLNARALIDGWLGRMGRTVPPG